MKKNKLIIILCMLAIFLPTADVFSQKIKMGLLVYGGGGDWYANPTSLKNLAKFS